MRGDWIKLHRKVMDSPIFSHDGMFRLWCYCLLRANWKDATCLVPGTLSPITIPRGSFITGRDRLAEALYGPDYRGEHKPESRTIWRWMKTLEEIGCIKTSTLSNRCSMVTVCKYTTYQQHYTDDVQQDDTPMSSTCPAGVPPVSTEEERKNLRRKESKKQPKVAVRDYSPEFLQFWEVFPSYRKGSKPIAWEAWQKAIQRKPASEVIVAAREYASSKTGQGEYVKGPAPWLNQDGWDDDRASWNRQANGTPSPSAPYMLPKRAERLPQ